MNEDEGVKSRALMPARRCDLAPVAHTNPLVSRGIVDLAQIQDLSGNNTSQNKLIDAMQSALQDIRTRKANLAMPMVQTSPHPFEPQIKPAYKSKLRGLKLLLRIREACQAKAPAPLPGQDTPSARLPASDPPLHPPGQDSTPKGSL